MITYFITTIEIALLVVFPLIWFYKQSNWSTKSYIFLIPVLYLVWFLTYGLLHELTHLFGMWIFGKVATNYQLMPHFWEGDFGTAFINYDFRGEYKDFLIVASPYIRDVLFVALGYYLIKQKVTANKFLVGLILIILVFSPLFDITNNYLGYAFGYKNDFSALKAASNVFVSHMVGVSFMIFAAYYSFKVLKLSRMYT